jgi:hypothetical protein
MLRQALQFNITLVTTMRDNAASFGVVCVFPVRGLQRKEEMWNERQKARTKNRVADSVGYVLARHCPKRRAARIRQAIVVGGGSGQSHGSPGSYERGVAHLARLT